MEQIKTKNYIVILPYAPEEKGIGRGLIVGEFDTYEETLKFYQQQNNPRLEILGPLEKTSN